MTHNRLGRRFQRRLDVPVWLERGPQGLAYSDKVLALNPIRYYPFWDDVGAALAEELIAGDDATYNGPTLGQPGIGDGNTAASFDGTNDNVDYVTAPFDAVFDGTLGSFASWCQVSGAGVWADGTQRVLIRARVDGTTYFFLEKRAAANTFRWVRNAQTDFRSVSRAMSDTNWFHIGLSWSDADDFARAYFNGVQEGADMVHTDDWVGALDSTTSAIGAQNTAGPSANWDGSIGHPAFWDSVLTDDEFLSLATL